MDMRRFNERVSLVLLESGDFGELRSRIASYRSIKDMKGVMDAAMEIMSVDVDMYYNAVSQYLMDFIDRKGIKQDVSSRLVDVMGREVKHYTAHEVDLNDYAFSEEVSNLVFDVNVWNEAQGSPLVLAGLCDSGARDLVSGLPGQFGKRYRDLVIDILEDFEKAHPKRIVDQSVVYDEPFDDIAALKKKSFDFVDNLFDYVIGNGRG